MNTEPIVVEKTYKAPVARVWQAITSKEEIKQWCFDTGEFKPEVGFEFSFYGGDENKQYLHHCKVTEVVPMKKLAYSWRFENDPGYSVVSFELFEEDKSTTRLRLTHDGVHTFSPAEPGFRKENFVAGWTDIIGNLLKKHLEG